MSPTEFLRLESGPYFPEQVSIVSNWLNNPSTSQNLQKIIEGRYLLHTAERKRHYEGREFDRDPVPEFWFDPASLGFSEMSLCHSNIYLQQIGDVPTGFEVQVGLVVMPGEPYAQERQHYCLTNGIHIACITPAQWVNAALKDWEKQSYAFAPATTPWQANVMRAKFIVDQQLIDNGLEHLIRKPGYCSLILEQITRELGNCELLPFPLPFPENQKGVGQLMVANITALQSVGLSYHSFKPFSPDLYRFLR